jgi:hypothetical protein
MYIDEASQIEKLAIAFAEMRKAGWDTDGELLWGYLFIDSDPRKLDALRKHLERIGFAFVDVFELADQNAGNHMLHVEKVETHGLSSLARRNVEFSNLALDFGVRDYDGWDAGKVERPSSRGSSLKSEGQLHMEAPKESLKSEPRSKSAYLFVNTIKNGLISGLPVLFGEFAWTYRFNVRSLDVEFFGFAIFVLVFALFVGLVVAAISWQRIQNRSSDGDPVTQGQKILS